MKITGDVTEVLRRWNERQKAEQRTEQENEIAYYIALISVIKGLIKWVNLPWCYTDTDCVKYCKADVEATKELLNAFYGRKQTEKENKKMTNKEKMKEVFGTELDDKTCFAFMDKNCVCIAHSSCTGCPYYGENWGDAEYKAPKKVRQRRARFFSSLDELLSYVHEHEIPESEVINVTRSEGFSSPTWCLTYNDYYYETPTVQTVEWRKKND